MKQFEIKSLGLEELTKNESVTVDGGKMQYIDPSITDNPLAYALIAVYNGVAYLVNLFCD